jgi:flagellar biosynthetic protein FlhB
MFGLLYLIWEWFVQRLMVLFIEFLNADSLAKAGKGLTGDELGGMFVYAVTSMAMILAPIFGTAMVIGFAAHFVQVGPLFTTESMKFKLSKINPISGFKRMFSIKTVVDLFKSLLKIIILGYIAVNAYQNMFNEFTGYIGTDPYRAFIEIMRNAFLLALQMCIALVFIAAADFLYQWWKYEKDLKMTKQEIKDEYKMMEGDPQIKGKIKAKQRQMSMMRMMSAVPEADVVITNPTHYAVALKYESSASSAPVVIAKGQDYTALKIRALAAEHNIQLVENPPLAQALFSMCEINDEIPSDFYQVVADILVSVYRQTGRTPAAATG